MSRMAEVYQDQQEQQNLSVANDFEAWMNENEGKYQCPYCGNVTIELVLCCGELHGREIGELNG